MQWIRVHYWLSTWASLFNLNASLRKQPSYRRLAEHLVDIAGRILRGAALIRRRRCEKPYSHCLPRCLCILAIFCFLKEAMIHCIVKAKKSQRMDNYPASKPTPTVVQPVTDATMFWCTEFQPSDVREILMNWGISPIYTFHTCASTSLHPIITSMDVNVLWTLKKTLLLPQLSYEVIIKLMHKSVQSY